MVNNVAISMGDVRWDDERRAGGEGEEEKEIKKSKFIVTKQ